MLDDHQSDFGFQNHLKSDWKNQKPVLQNKAEISGKIQEAVKK